MKYLLTFLIILLLSPSIYSEDEKKVQLDYLALASLLVKDQHFERASEALSHVDLKEKGIDLPKYYLLKGIISNHKKDYKEAIKNFNLSIKKGS